jgi:hypothetical protein
MDRTRIITQALLFFLLVLLLPNEASAQLSEPRLYITGSSVQDQYVEISYDITYAGFTEIHLFNNEGEKLWIKGKVDREIGSHALRIPTKPLQSGERYEFILMYKGREYPGSFYMN